jgi:hypothetical protein
LESSADEFGQDGRGQLWIGRDIVGFANLKKSPDYE